MTKTKFFLSAATLCIGAAFAPAFLPDPLLKAVGVSPIYVSHIPLFETPQKKIRHDIEERFSDAPDVVYTQVLSIALDPTYPAEAVVSLAPDLLSDAYSSDHMELPDGSRIATHSSILSEALRNDRFDIVAAALTKTGTETVAARHLAIQQALLSHDDFAQADRAQHYLEIFAAAGGSAVKTRRTTTDETLAEILLQTDHRALMYFVNQGFEPFMSLDLRFYDIGGISLAEIATLKGNDEQIRGVHYLLHKGGVPQPDIRVSANMLANLKSREDLSSEFDDLLRALELRSKPIDRSE